MNKEQLAWSLFESRLMRALSLTTFLLASLLCVLSPTKTHGKEAFVTIGGGDYTGVYFPTGLAIARTINEKQEQYGIRASVQATDGSTFNLNAIRAGYLEFGLVQADTQYRAANGLIEWSDSGPDRNLRSVFSIYPETVTLVAATDTGVEKVADLKGKKVSLGNPGSSEHRNVMSVLKAAGIDPEQDIISTEVNASDAPAWLQDGVIDAYFFTVGHPSQSIRLALSGVQRKARLIPISGPEIDQLVADNSYYSKSIIKVRELYPDLPGTTEDIESIAVMATLCTSAKVADDIVYAITKEVVENLDVFRNLHPALKDMCRETLLDGLSADIHPGALKYYREAGITE